MKKKIISTILAAGMALSNASCCMLTSFASNATYTQPAEKPFTVSAVVSSAADADNDLSYDINVGDTGLYADIYINFTGNEEQFYPDRDGNRLSKITLAGYQINIGLDERLSVTGITDIACADSYADNAFVYDAQTHTVSGFVYQIDDDLKIYEVTEEESVDGVLKPKAIEKTPVRIARIYFSVDYPNSAYDTPLSITPDDAEISIKETSKSMEADYKGTSVEISTKYNISWSSEGRIVAEKSVPYNYPVEDTDEKGNPYENPSKKGFTFIGWSSDGDETVDVAPNASFPAAGSDTVYEAIFEINSYDLVWDHNYKKNNVEVVTTDKDKDFGEIITEPQAPSRTGYTFDGWYKEASCSNKVDFTNLTMPAEGVRYYAKWTVINYKAIFNNEDGTKAGEVIWNVEDTDISDKIPDVADKPGYEGRWSDFELDKENPSDITVNPIYTPITYTVTFDANGGSAVQAHTYNIESQSKLPITGRDNYTFSGWKVISADGNWVLDSVHSAGEDITGKYGNVTLQAVWTVTHSYVVEQYKYAKSTDVLLIVSANKDKGTYYYDGQKMFYTEDVNYRSSISTNPKYVFLTIIPNGSYDPSKLTFVTETNSNISVDRDGDVNNDAFVSITDVTAVNNMVRNTGDAYDDMSVQDRLEADTSTPTSDTQYRASILDVSAIISKLNK